MAGGWALFAAGLGRLRLSDGFSNTEAGTGSVGAASGSKGGLGCSLPSCGREISEGSSKLIRSGADKSGGRAVAVVPGTAPAEY
jgi:hypothetical protein